MLRVVARGVCRRFCAPGVRQVWKTQRFSTSAPTAPPKPAPTAPRRFFIQYKKFTVVKTICIAVGGLLFVVTSDTCFLLWNLYHPELPNLTEPVLRVDMSEAEDKILEQMNGDPQFMLLYGIPGCGKTTTVVSAARRRGKAVIYYLAESGGSLQPFEDLIQKKFGASMPGILELLGRRSRTMRDTLTKAGEVWRDWCCPAEDPARSLVIVFDGVHRLKKEDMYKLAGIGKEATDRSSFSLWLVSSEERGVEILVHLSDALARLTGMNLPPVSEKELVRMAKSALGGHPGAAELAEWFVYLTGSSLSLLWMLLRGASKGNLMSPIQGLLNSNSMPPLDNKEKEFLKLLLASGERGVKRQAAPINWTCLQPDGGSVKLRSRYCRDLVSFWVATAEATAATAEASAATAEATAADAAASAAGDDYFRKLSPDPRTGEVATLIESSKRRYEAAMDKAKAAVAAVDAAVAARNAAIAARDATGAVVSSNELAVADAASRYLADRPYRAAHLIPPDEPRG